MSSFQQVIIIGNLGDDPQTRQFDGGGMVANLSIATTETWLNKQGEKQEATEWHRCVAFNKSAETLEKYCKKGDKLMITGKMKTRKYTDGQGVEKYTTEVFIDSFKFLTSKQQAPAQNQGSAVDDYQNRSAQAPATNFNNEEHDDLPFSVGFSVIPQYQN